MMKTLLVLAIVLACTGCTRSPAVSEADNRVLWGNDGCAFMVSKHVGDTSFVRRLPDADRSTCTLKEPDND